MKNHLALFVSIGFFGASCGGGGATETNEQALQLSSAAWAQRCIRLFPPGRERAQCLRTAPHGRGCNVDGSPPPDGGVGGAGGTPTDGGAGTGGVAGTGGTGGTPDDGGAGTGGVAGTGGTATGGMPGDDGGASDASDTSPPVFAGLVKTLAVSEHQVALSWSNATDDRTPPSGILYDVCFSTTSGACTDHFVAMQTTPIGSTMWNVGRLEAGTRTYFVVRARDEAGNRDDNALEIGVDTPPLRVLRAGGDHTCARSIDGSVRCWGNSSTGALGNGITLNARVPVLVAGIDALDVTAGYVHSCAALNDGTARCWGGNPAGQVGDGTTGTNRLVPVPVGQLTNVVALTAGFNHTCALGADGIVSCWGANSSGQAGQGTTVSPLLTPAPVTGLPAPVTIHAGPTSSHTCAVLPEGTVKCWGANESGQIGDGTIGGFRAQPVTVNGLASAVTVVAAASHTCALLLDGTVWCWGRNSTGELGIGPAPTQPLPQMVPGLSGVVHLTSGGVHTCAILANGSGYCWGLNDSAQLGPSTPSPFSPTPVASPGLSSAVAATVGVRHSCALRPDGRVFCWGTNLFGELGNGALSDTPSSSYVAGLDLDTGGGGGTGGTGGGGGGGAGGAGGTGGSGCMPDGALCDGTHPCCSGIACTNNICGKLCVGTGAACDATQPCCTGDACMDGICGIATCVPQNEWCGDPSSPSNPGPACCYGPCLNRVCHQPGCGFEGANCNPASGPPTQPCCPGQYCIGGACHRIVSCVLPGFTCQAGGECCSGECNTFGGFCL